MWQPGQPYFLTEKQIEAKLELATRELSMPDGTVLRHADFMLTWNLFDYLVLVAGWSRADLIKEAFRISKETGDSFGDSFTDVLNWARDHFLS